MIKIKEKIWTYLEKGVFSFVDFSSWIVNVLAKVYFRQKLFSLIGIFLFRFVLFSFILTSAEGTFPWIGKKSAEAIYLHFRVNYGKCQDKPIVRRDNYNSHRSENFNHGSLNYSVPILGFKIYFSCKKRLQNELLIHKNIFNLLSVWQNLVLFISY